MHVLKKCRKYLVLPAAVSLAILSLLINTTDALFLSDRSIQISTAIPSATATHIFQFTYGSTSPVGSVAFEYCENSPVFDYTCDAPAGLDVSSATLSTQSGNTGFNFDSINSTANKIVITRVPSASAAVASSYTFTNITNPSSPAQAEFVRISTHASADGSGAFIDNGAVAFATASAFNIGASVPPFLQLCVAITVAPNCSAMSGDRLNLGNLSTSKVKAGTSQFAVGTNSATGYIAYVLGTTMTSGNNAITALGSPTPSFPGNNQFGINLRNNSIPNVGADPFGSGSGAPTANYNTQNLYMFHSGDDIVVSNLPSNYNRMTVSYIVNINSSQSPGIYSTTFTYLTVANF